MNIQFSAKESILALEGAEMREEESIHLYRESSERAQNIGTKAILDELAREEESHFAIVSELLRQARAGEAVPSLDIPESTDAKDFLEGTFKHHALAQFHAEIASVDKMLEKAVENELESFNLYSRMADTASEPETASVFRYLASQENKHFDMVNNLLNFMGNPGRWVYEEENLIFRNG